MNAKTQAYGEPWYWDNRYAQDPGPFDWYQKYTSLSPLLRLYIPHHHRVLLVGCGNSAFGEGMVDDGYEDVVNIDISSVVIEAMQKNYSNRPNLKYIKMDVRDMSAFETGSFDAVIDKGTLDSLLVSILCCNRFMNKPDYEIEYFLQCGYNSQQNAAKMLEEVCRVLKDNGVYILITYGSPVYRLRLLRESCSWTIKLHVIEKLPSADSSENRSRDLTSPILLEDGGSLETVVGKNADLHYIYVCSKDKSWR